MSQSESETSKSKAYDGNPFSTAWRGVRKLFDVNGQLLIGLAFFNTLAIIILFVTAGIVGFVLVAYIINHSPDFVANAIANSQSPYLAERLSALADRVSSVKDMHIFITAALGSLFLLGFGSFLKALQITVALASSSGKALSFNFALKQSFKRTMPIAEVYLILLAAFLTTMLITNVLIMSSQFIGPIAIILNLVVWIIAFYVFIRLSLAKFILIDNTSADSVSALKRSWAITNGHFVEILGIGSVIFLAINVVALLWGSLLAAADGSSLMALIEVLGFAMFVLATTLVIAAISERYIQIAHNKANKNPEPTNYLAIVLVVMFVFYVAAISNHNAVVNPGQVQVNSPNQDSGAMTNQAYPSLN
ncbi:MAG TPA: hypothetical protein VNX65_04710 [Patescibacteria group bacterium]|jgi:hypothetical protein|nr:hypothetical protein [Patescibacteria group bacterium]